MTLKNHSWPVTAGIEEEESCKMKRKR